MSIACAAMLVACWQEQAVSTTRLAPGPLPLPGVHRIGVGQIVGGDAQGLARALTDVLLHVDGFVVFDALGQTGHYGRTSYLDATPLGYDEVDALVTAQIITQHIHEDIDFEAMTGPYGAPQSTLYYRRGIVTIAADFSVLDARTHRILGTTRLQHTFRSADDTVHLPETDVRSDADIVSLFAPLDESALLAQAQWVVAERFAAQVAPHREAAVVTLYTLPSQPQSLWAQQAAQAGDWLQAMELYAQGVDAMETRYNASHSDRAKAYYNLGVAYGFAGYYDEARQALRVSLFASPMPQTRAAQRQIETFAQEAQVRAAAFNLGGLDAWTDTGL